ncbi:flagellar motor switch protein FliG [Salinihabitans flavidus]|uniref:Flagellar motor switch protein FliG n=1 Tax=Salinihabitans flavidus TaxID=569882 RepID=A0A1H8RNQ8_9RHOB|nr:FliG C-terminal domain-containing protein [Salinihabitans flavidus]SEO67804.1 flagellar motor switch protein FliG [Salinihabitans flavidus]
MSDMSPLAQLPPPAPARLSRRQKAAIIVRFLLNEGADVALTELPDELQGVLTQQMGAMRYVDRDTLTAVVMEFAAELEGIGLSFPRGIAGALNALEGRISPMTAARLRKEAGVRQAGDPWQRIRALPVKQILPMIEGESTEVAAVILSMLDVTRAAELLGALPGEQARRITYAISLTGSVTPEAVDRIGLSLAMQLDDRAPRAFDAEPVERVGEILNYSQSMTRDDVLTGLDETDAEFASRVRRAIFTYEHIPERIDPRDVPRIVREVDQATLINALAAAREGDAGDATNFILSNMSTRMADQLREDMQDAGQIATKDGEAAMSAIIAAVRALEAAGEIKLLRREEEEEPT